MPWWPNQPGVVPPGVNEPETRAPAQASGKADPAAGAQVGAAAAPPATPPASTALAQADTGMPSAAAAPALANRYVQTSRYGDLVFVSGQIALDLQTNAFVNGAIAAQTTQVLRNIQSLLAAEGLTMANIVSATVYLDSLADLEDLEPAYEAFFKGRMPARSVVQVSALPRGALVEISVIAGR